MNIDNISKYLIDKDWPETKLNKKIKKAYSILNTRELMDEEDYQKYRKNVLDKVI